MIHLTLTLILAFGTAFLGLAPLENSCMVAREGQKPIIQTTYLKLTDKHDQSVEICGSIKGIKKSHVEFTTLNTANAEALKQWTQKRISQEVQVSLRVENQIIIKQSCTLYSYLYDNVNLTTDVDISFDAIKYP